MTHLIKSASLAAVLVTVVAAMPQPSAAQDATPSAEQMEEGQTLFVTNCRQCHGMKGTAGAPLAENEKLADPAFVAETIIVGPGYMTAFGDFLDDAQIAAIATYVRNSWGNAYGPVAPEEVAPLR